MAVPTALRTLLALPDAERRIGPFELVRPLGRGGYAPVWLARETYGGTELRTAAVKLFSLAPGATRLTSADAFRDQVLAEARALCEVEHPNVVRFYSVLVDEARGVMGLAMEHVAGQPLDRRIEAEGKLSIDAVVEVGLAVASALSAVHRAGLVHRDVKPANVVEALGVPKLIDFGIASADRKRRTPRVVDDLPMDEAEGASGATGAAVGTPGYVEPAAQRGEPAVPSTDLYALGATLYECLTGRLPAAPASDGVGLDPEILGGAARPPPVAGARPDAPAALARLVDALLAPERAERPRSAEAVAVELERLRRERAGRARELPPEDAGPFRGLGRYELADRDVYFGRGVEIAVAVEMLRARGALALIGPSGSGKSSLARAGILPAIAAGDLGPWPKAWDAVVVAPGLEPRAALGAALSPIVADAAARAPEALVAAIADRVQESGRGVVLLVDQLEELATLEGDPEGRTWVARVVAGIAERPIPGVRCVLAARRDLLDPLLAIPELGPVLVRGSHLVAPLDDRAWQEVLDQALAAYGYAFEDDMLRDEVQESLRGKASAMPLVEFALTRIWEHRDRAAKRVTRDGVREVGGIAGALDRHAEATLARVVAEDAQGVEVVRAILLGLTTPQGTRAVRTRGELEALGDDRAGRRALALLEEGRLVVAEGGGLTLAHDALLANWSRLRSWVAAAREDRTLAELLEADAERWEAVRDPAMLWRRERLESAEELVARGAVALSPRAFQFVDEGRRAARVRRNLVAGGAVIAAVLVVSALGLWVRSLARDEARARADLAHTRDEQRRIARELLVERHAAVAARADAQQSRRDVDDVVKKLDRRLDDARREATSAEASMKAGSTEDAAKALASLRRDLDDASRLPGGVALIGSTETSGGRLSDELAVLQGLVEPLRLCYRRELAEHPDAKGTVVVSARVDGEGQVTQARATGGEGLPESVGDCAALVVSRALFAPPAGNQSAELTIPIRLEPR